MDVFQRKSTKSLTEIPKTKKVLLVCILNRKSVIITHDFMYCLFSKYGKVNKILLFEKAKIWKFFLEMSCEQDAIDAKTALDNYKIFDDEAKINIFFSHLETVNLNSTTIDGKDYTNSQANFEAEAQNHAFSGRKCNKKAFTMKMEANSQQMGQIFLTKSEENPQKPRESTSLERYFDENKATLEIKSPKTSVIHVKGLLNKGLKLQCLRNLFSNFGNIKKIIFFKDIGSALIEFTTEKYAEEAINYLNNATFLGFAMQISFSKYQSLSLKKGNCLIEKTIYQNQEVHKANKSEYRFKTENNLQINPPSNILHVSNINCDYFQEDFVAGLFGKYGNILKLKMLYEKDKKFMCLVKFEKIEESLNAVAFLHNFDLCGRKLQISFSKSKL